jgi:hypothetical protein
VADSGDELVFQSLEALAHADIADRPPWARASGILIASLMMHGRLTEAVDGPGHSNFDARAVYEISIARFGLSLLCAVKSYEMFTPNASRNTDLYVSI